MVEVVLAAYFERKLEERNEVLKEGKDAAVKKHSIVYILYVSYLKIVGPATYSSVSLAAILRGV